MTLPKEIIFLSLKEVLAFHRDQINHYGGTLGIRDKGLIQSALAQPFATFGGELLHSSIYLMAAAYLLSLARNHGFIDGNKRTAVVVARVFLYINGFLLQPDEDEFYEIVDAVAQGKLSKAELAEFLERNSIRENTIVED